ncbi:MATE family efflux transporter [Gilvimarinus polysaccharolyticus]|uniref:MATE family efflux transporter n=1 Tax=Gilvimarinus polysaccharolyticus TaxID=863921 RepID=UPI00067334E6|nr:MATE family efflux transporter [Gilvimarinus polysaccharolyticus]
MTHSNAYPKPSRGRLRGIWPLVWPIMLSNLCVPLLGAVDTAILGHLDTSRFLGAVAIGASLVSLLYWSFGFLRMGTTSLVSRAVGAADQTEATLLWLRSAVLALALAVCLLLLKPWLIELGLYLMRPESGVASLAASYCAIRLLSAPATLLNYTLIGWFIGQQDTRRPLLLVLMANGVNLLLDVVLIIGLEMNSDGAAWASVIAEYCALAVGLYLLAAKIDPACVSAHWRACLTCWRDYLPLLQVNRHLFVRTACLLGVFTFFTAQGAQMSTNIVAANAILLQFVLLTSHALDGFAHAAEALCGKAVGGHNRTEFVRVVQGTTALALLTALAISLLFWLGQDYWLALFTALPQVLAQTKLQFGWVIALPLLTVWAYQLDGVFLGCGATRAMQNTMLACTAVVFFPLWWITQPLGNSGLWLAFCGFNLARSLAMGLVFVILQRQLKNNA